MSAANLHDAFALLLRDHQSETAALGTLAVRSIRRRVATRWAGRLGTLLIVGALATAALQSADGGADRLATGVKSPIATPKIGFASATFPLTGGPEFVPASSELRCGDPAPAPHPVEHDLSLTLRPGHVFTLGDQPARAAGATVEAVVRQISDADQGAVATSGVDFVLVQDGIIQGLISGEGVNLAQNLAGGTVTVPWSGMLAEGVYCSDGRQAVRTVVAPGTYEVIAIGRVFSTAESVALAQALGADINTFYLNPNGLADPASVYLPGHFSCKQARVWRAALRGCLPEITDNAVVDEAAGTVTVVYRAKSLVEEFSTVLVSEPVTVELFGGQGVAITAAATL